MKVLKVVFTKKTSMQVIEYDNVTSISINNTNNRYDLGFSTGGSGYVYGLTDYNCRIIGLVSIS